MVFSRSVFALAVLAVSVAAHSQNLVVNGDFSLGNVGFASDYPYVPFNGTNTATVVNGDYTVGNIVPPSYPDWYPFQDHTTGAGNLMTVNGAASAAERIWAETVPVAPNTTYRIGFFLAEISNPVSVADVDVRSGSTPLGDFAAPTTQDVWQGHSLLWNSGTATTLVLSLHDLNTSGDYNDFALDDISVQATPEPTTFAALGLGALGLLRLRRKA